MKELLFFILGIFLGGFIAMTLMLFLMHHLLNDDEDRNG